MASSAGLIEILIGQVSEIGFEDIRILLIKKINFLHPRVELKRGSNTHAEKPNYKYGYGEHKCFSKQWKKVIFFSLFLLVASSFGVLRKTGG